MNEAAQRKGIRQPAVVDRRLRKCFNEFYEFVKEFWDVIIPDPYVDNWHIRYLCDELQHMAERVFESKPAEYDLVINIPPGTTKSTIVSVMFPAWCWVRAPWLRFLTGSYTPDISLDHAVKSRDILKSDKFAQVFQPHFVEVWGRPFTFKKDTDNKSDYANCFQGSRFSTSTGGSATGRHAHILLVDDPINPKKAASTVELKNASDWLDKTLSTRKVDKAVTPTIMVMQRLHEDDPTGHVLAKVKDGKKVKHICLPGEVSKRVSPPELKEHYIDGLLDPNRLSREILTTMRTDLGSYGYAGQIMQAPSPEEGGIWKKHFIIPIKRAEIPVALFEKRRTFWDTAYTTNEANSASAYVDAGIHANKVYITDIGWDWVEFPQLIAMMKRRKAPHVIEAKATGKSAKQTLVSEGIDAIEFHIKSDKLARTHDVTPTGEAGRIFIAEDLHELLFDDPKQGLKHLSPANPDIDLNDALVIAVTYLTRKNTSDGGPGDWGTVKR